MIRIITVACAVSDGVGRSRWPREVWPSGETPESKRKHHEQGKTEDEKFHDGQAESSEAERKAVFPRETGVLGVVA